MEQSFSNRCIAFVQRLNHLASSEDALEHPDWARNALALLIDEAKAILRDKDTSDMRRAKPL